MKSHTIFIAFLALVFCGCSQPIPAMPRPSFVPSEAHYVGGADGGVWVALNHQAGANYVITFFGRKGASRHAFKMVGSEGEPEPITVKCLTGWDGVVMHLENPLRKLILIK